MTEDARGRAASSPARRVYLLQEPLPHGHLFDCGVLSYDEFACSHSTLSMLRATWNDARLQVVDECVGGHNVIVKAWPKENR